MRAAIRLPPRRVAPPSYTSALLSARMTAARTGGDQYILPLGAAWQRAAGKPGRMPYVKVHPDGRAVRHEQAVGDPKKHKGNPTRQGSMSESGLSWSNSSSKSAKGRVSHALNEAHVAVEVDEADAREFAHAILNRKLTPDRIGEVRYRERETVRRIALRSLTD